MKDLVPENQGSPTRADLLGVLIENQGSDLHLKSGEVRTRDCVRSNLPPPDAP